MSRSIRPRDIQNRNVSSLRVFVGSVFGGRNPLPFELSWLESDLPDESQQLAAQNVFRRAGDSRGERMQKPPQFTIAAGWAFSFDDDKAGRLGCEAGRHPGSTRLVGKSQLVIQCESKVAAR